MARRGTSMSDSPRKGGSLCGCIGCFFIWLFPIALALGVALYFTPNERVANIVEYNKRADLWKTIGMEDFSNNTITIEVNGKPYELTKTIVKATELYPCGDKCDKEGDPESGCVRVDSVFFRAEIPYTEGKMEVTLADSMHMQPYKDTIEVSHSKEYLQRVCYRIGDIAGSILDLPPGLTIGKNVTDAGCDFSNNWEPYYYSNKKADKIILEARYYMDPYVSSSYLTRGCSENEGNKNCFGLSHKEMTTYGLYGIIAAGSITVIELITFLSMCICCRDKLNCCSREDDNMSY